jgi:hypothetical protein
VRELAGAPACGVTVQRYEYQTVGARDEAVRASAALMLPSGDDARCQGARPLLLYAHGTAAEQAFDLSDVHATENAEAQLLAALFAARGYVVVAPNYAGYAGSTLPYHPYLVADQQAGDMMDALAAARSALRTATAPAVGDDGRLFVTGYSQGGYVAMATQRALESAGQAVTASAPLSGPYALSAFVDAVFAGRVNGGAPLLAAFLFTSYQRAYGDAYLEAPEIFAAPYATTIDNLLPTAGKRGELYSGGQLPQDALFEATAPDPAYASVTPATEPAGLADVYALGFGSGALIRNDYRLRYLRDMEAHPDRYWPVATTAEPPADPQLPLRRTLARNDLRNWSPRSPTLLCGGRDDPTVFWLNTEAMQAYWATRAPAAPVTVLDVDAAPADGGDAYGDLKRRFGVAKDLLEAAAVAQGADDGGRRAVLEVYHAGLVGPFCLLAARSFFESR